MASVNQTRLLTSQISPVTLCPIANQTHDAPKETSAVKRFNRFSFICMHYRLRVRAESVGNS